MLISGEAKSGRILHEDTVILARLSLLWELKTGTILENLKDSNGPCAPFGNVPLKSARH
jgi:hypothetical protein